MIKFKNKIRRFALAGVSLLCLTAFAGLLSMTSTAYSAETTPVVELDNATTFTFSEEGIAVSEESTTAYQIIDQSLTIYKSGTYVLTGNGSNASVKVAKGTSDVILVLDGVHLSNDDGAVIKLGKISEVSIVVQGDNTLAHESDGGGAAIKIKSGATLDISGDGSLSVNTEDGANGIQGASGARLTVSGISLTINAVNHAISVDGSVTLISGIYNLTAGNEAIQSMPEEGDCNSEGKVTILDGTYTLTAEGDGVQAQNDLTIGIEGDSEGPSLQINSKSEALEADNITLYSGSGSFVASDVGVNAVSNKKSSITIDGGEWDIHSTEEGLLANGTLRITGGETTVYSKAGTSDADVVDGSLVVQDSITETAA